MAKEILEIPEEYLYDVICVIRIGLEISKLGIPNKTKKTNVVIDVLEKWCNEEYKYVKRMNGEE